MPFALVVSAKGAGNAGTDAVTPQVDTTGAKLIVLAGTGVPSVQPLSFFDAFGNTWSLLTQQVAAGNPDLVTQLAYCINPVVGSGHDFTQGGGYPSICMAAFSGVGAFDQQAGSSGFSSVVSPGPLTPPSDDSLIIVGGGGVSGAYVSINSGFTLEQSQQHNTGQSVASFIGFKIQTAAGSEQPACSFNTTDELMATLATFTLGGGSILPLVARDMNNIGDMGAMRG